MCEDSCLSCQPINEQYLLEHVENGLLLVDWLTGRTAIHIMVGYKYKQLAITVQTPQSYYILVILTHYGRIPTIMCEDNCSSCQPINEQYSLEHVDNVLLLFNWLKSHHRCSIIYLLNFGYILVTFWLHFG